MGDTQTQNNVAQIISDATACAASLSETIERQNQVMLAYCGALIDQSLRVMNAIKELEKNGNTDSANIGQLKTDLINAISQQSDDVVKKNAALASTTSAQIIKLPDGVDMVKDANSAVAAYVQSISLSMANAVYAQQQMNVTAQAATTMAITRILNSTAS